MVEADGGLDALAATMLGHGLRDVDADVVGGMVDLGSLRIVDLHVDVAADVGDLERRGDERGELGGVEINLGDLPHDDLAEVDRRGSVVEAGGADVDDETEQR